LEKGILKVVEKQIGRKKQFSNQFKICPQQRKKRVIVQRRNIHFWDFEWGAEEKQNKQWLTGVAGAENQP